ncbi:MAG: caspase family protein [Elusimicrobiota bacterium]
MRQSLGNAQSPSSPSKAFSRRSVFSAQKNPKNPEVRLAMGKTPPPPTSRPHSMSPLSPAKNGTKKAAAKHNAGHNPPAHAKNSAPSNRALHELSAAARGAGPLGNLNGIVAKPNLPFVKKPIKDADLKNTSAQPAMPNMPKKSFSAGIKGANAGGSGGGSSAGSGGGSGGASSGGAAAASPGQAQGPQGAAGSPQAAGPSQPAPALSDASSGVGVSSATSSGKSRKYALVIGVERYPSFPPAAFAVRDAKDFSHCLRNILGVPKSRLIVLYGHDATAAALHGALTRLSAKGMISADRLYVYYAGYGARRRKNGRSELVLRNAAGSNASFRGYLLARFYRALASLKANRIMVFFDAGFSGPGGRFLAYPGAKKFRNKKIRPPPGKISVLTADAGMGGVWASQSRRHGLFTYSLIQELKKAASSGSGAPQLGVLADAVKKDVAAAAKQRHHAESPKLWTKNRRLKVY